MTGGGELISYVRGSLGVEGMDERGASVLG
jgi:hypothetical protein